MSTKIRTQQPLEDAVARRQAVEEDRRDGRDRPAFGSRDWFDAVYPPLLGYLRSFAARWADDAASVALLRFHEKGPHGSPLGVQIAWLKQTGHNWIAGQLRSPGERYRVPFPPDRVEPVARGDELANVVRDGLARFLSRLRRGLPKELDEVIHLRFDLAMTLRQIADQLFGERATNGDCVRVQRRIEKALSLLRSGLQRAGLNVIPCEWEGFRNVIQGASEDQIKVLEFFYGTDLSYEEIGERVCPEVVPAGRGSRARRLHRIALVHLLRRYSGSHGGRESRPGFRAAGCTISRGRGATKSGESVFIWEGGINPPVRGVDSSRVRRHVRIDAADPAVPGSPRLEAPWGARIRGPEPILTSGSQPVF
jgi:DNA-directed RNA polymerase specialized sigma24 family protein